MERGTAITKLLEVEFENGRDVVVASDSVSALFPLLSQSCQGLGYQLRRAHQDPSKKVQAPLELLSFDTTHEKRVTIIDQTLWLSHDFDFLKSTSVIFDLRRPNLVDITLGAEKVSHLGAAKGSIIIIESGNR